MRNLGASSATGWKGAFWRRASRFLRNCSRSDVDPDPDPGVAAAEPPTDGAAVDGLAAFPMIRGITDDASCF